MNSQLWPILILALAAAVPSRGEEPASTPAAPAAQANENPAAAAPKAVSPPTPVPPDSGPRSPGSARIVVAQAPAVDPAKVAPMSVAEQVTRLRRAIESDEARLLHIQREYDDPNGEFSQAESVFNRVDSKLEAAKKALKALPENNQAARGPAAAEVARLEKFWKLEKDRFDLAIETRKVSAEQIANLTQKIRRDRRALNMLEGKEPVPSPSLAPAPSSTSAMSPTAARPESGGSPAVAPVPSPSSSSDRTGTTSDAPQAQAVPAAPSAPQAVAGAPAAAVAPQAPAGEASPPVNKKLVKAQHDVETKASVSKAAENEAESVTKRLQSLDKEVALEQKLLATARKQRDNATEIRDDLTKSFRERSLTGAPREELDGLLAHVKKLEDRVAAAVLETQEHSTRLEELQSERAGLQAERLAALHTAAEARAQVKVAEAEIKRLENPFSAENVLFWLVEHGPRMLCILLAMLAGYWLSKIFSQRVIRLLAHSGARGSSVEREARARTLVGVFQNAASLAVIVGGSLMIFQAAGIPIGPLLGGAAVFGLAVAFGAQNLIRDYFYGFVILLENQYKLNDVVQIGEISGQVENITLRMTVLRDLEGKVHFLPNGQITAVTNMTHGWSRALFDIGVAYKEDVDRVIHILNTLAAELRADPTFSPMILEDATMLGVDSLGESSVNIKFFIKTRPLQQWNVKRELLRRIKNRFDELNIEIPFPHRTVYHRVEPGAGMPDLRGGVTRLPRGVHSHPSSS